MHARLGHWGGPAGSEIRPFSSARVRTIRFGPFRESEGIDTRDQAEPAIAMKVAPRLAGVAGAKCRAADLILHGPFRMTDHQMPRMWRCVWHLPHRPVGPVQVLLEPTDSGSWVVPKLQRAEPIIQAQMAAQGFTHDVVAYVPKITTSGSSSTANTACGCGYDSLAFRQPNAQTLFGPRDPTAVDAARADPVSVSLSVAPAVLTAARGLLAVVNLTQADCCAFAMLVDVEWRLQAPNGTHLLSSLEGAGAAEVVAGSRLSVSPLALPADASPYTVGVLVRHSATQAVLGIGLQTFFVVDPPPQGVLSVTPQSGMCLTPRSRG